MSPIRQAHLDYRNLLTGAALTTYKKRHRGSRFAGTARANTQGGKAAST